MLNILITDEKLQAQVQHHLRIGEAFEIARSILESGAVRVGSLSSATPEEKVENTVLLRGFWCTQNRDSHNNSA